MGNKLHVFFFPIMAPGHMIPILDLAKLFASRGVRSTLVTTPLNAPLFARCIEKTKQSGLDIDIRVIEFPAPDAPSLEVRDQQIELLTSIDKIWEFLVATNQLKVPFEQLIRQFRPDCIVADPLLPWARLVAAKFEIPSLVFSGTSYLSNCVSHIMRFYKPFENALHESEAFVVPHLPHELTFTRKQVPSYEIEGSKAGTWGVSEMVIFNSFYELEPDYVDHYHNVLGRKTWPVGPLFLFNRGMEAPVDEHDCLKWLDSMEGKSVVYVSFGSMSRFAGDQLREIAVALEACGQPFVWVLRKDKTEGEDEDWMPRGLEERWKDKGMILRGWVPQVSILDHQAVGGFVTHCGWNSTLEGICAGVPMVTWPLFAEQFYNEKLVTEILGIGVSVGAKEWTLVAEGGIKREDICAAIKRVMVGKEAEEMRGRAEELKEKAWKAIGDGGSSSSALDSLIEELTSIHCLID